MWYLSYDMIPTIRYSTHHTIRYLPRDMISPIRYDIHHTIYHTIWYILSTIRYDIYHTIWRTSIYDTMRYPITSWHTDPPIVAAEHEVVQRRGHLIPVLLHELRSIIDNLPRKVHHPKRGLRAPQITTSNPANVRTRSWRVSELWTTRGHHAWRIKIARVPCAKRGQRWNDARGKTSVEIRTISETARKNRCHRF